MKPVTLFDEAALKKRCTKARYDILRRAKPVLWKSGKRMGKVKKPGIQELAFTSNDLWQRALSLVGTGAVRCPYCVEIGRPANLITLANYVWDHKVPAADGGGHTLANLFPVCEDCNRCKGDLSYEFFIGIMAAAERWDSPSDRTRFHACLRTHGVSQRLRGFHGKPKNDAQAQPPAEQMLALREDF